MLPGMVARAAASSIRRAIRRGFTSLASDGSIVSPTKRPDRRPWLRETTTSDSDRSIVLNADQDGLKTCPYGSQNAALRRHYTGRSRLLRRLCEELRGYVFPMAARRAGRVSRGGGSGL